MATTFILTLFYIILYLLSRGKYGEIHETYKQHYQLGLFAPMSLYLLEKTRLMERFPQIAARFQHQMMILHGQQKCYLMTKCFFALLFSVWFVSLYFFTFISAVQADEILFYFGLLISVVLAYVLIHTHQKKIEERRNRIIIELPEFIHAVILLVGAGETLQQAMIHVVEKKDEKESDLYQELRQAVNEMNNQVPFAQVLERFSKRCGIPEVSVFTATVMLNYRRGGQEFLIALRMLSKELWDKRKSLTRTMGERASSKLVFPMIIIFITILMIISTPAMMLF